MDKTFNKVIVALLIACLFVFPMAGGNGGVQAQDFYPPTLEPYLSADGLTLYNGVSPLVVVVDSNPAMQGIQVPMEPEVAAAIEAAIANPEAASAAFSITYQAAGTTDPWGATCQTFPAEAQTAFNAAAAIWTSTIQSPVPITISACWSDLGSPTILGRSGYQTIYRNFSGAPKTDTWYAPALANALHGSDLDASEFDNYITHNSGFSWYTGLDGIVPAGQYDLVTVAAHEIAHGLNFSGSASYSGETGSYGYGTGYPNIYDTFMEDSGGTKLTTYTKPSTALGSLLTSGSLWFDGTNANAANGGSRVKIYAPSPWVGGSSYGHLDYSTFAGTANSMMVFAVGSGSSQHNPGPVTQGLLKDLGWVLAGETPLYVKPVASGTGNCQSWDNACTLQTALTGAVSGNEIWAAAGTYKPTTGTDRSATFQLKNGVALYGGFAGTETERTQRNPAVNVTTLSGGIGTDDVSDNSFHVVTGATGATLDGFTITAGNAGNANGLGDGGGIYNNSSSPTLTNITFSSNSADFRGGGMFNLSSNPTLTDVTFTNNVGGGGMFNLSSSPTLTNVTFNGNLESGMCNYSLSNPMLTNVTFIDNSANYGGGMFNDSSSPTLTNVTFSGNSADGFDGGGMYNEGNSSPTLTNVTFSGNSSGTFGGGMYNLSSNPTLTNVTFSGNNSAGDGGGMYNYSSSSPTLTDVTFSNNSASDGGGGMYNYSSSSPTLTDVTFSFNTASIGGGMKNDSLSNPMLTNVTFSENEAFNNGGGMSNSDSSPMLTNVTFYFNVVSHHGGGMGNFSSNPTLTNVTFSFNMASDRGGGMYNFESSPTLTNVTYSGNSASDGGGMYNYVSSNATIRNTIFWGNTARNAGAQIFNNGSSSVVSDSVVQDGCPWESTCTKIYTNDPKLGTLGNYGGFTQTIPLQAGSSAIDTGNDATCPATDQRGVSRPQGAHCDIGAYEYEYVDTTAPTVNTFTVVTPSNSLNIPITAFSATDDVAVTGYLITESATVPVTGATSWTGTPPATYTAASDGSYTLYPWAKDAAGHVSAVSASPRAVVVDTTAPDTQIDTQPANPNNSANASFTFSSADGTAMFECSLEGGAFAACTSPKDYTGLAAGSHTFAVRAKDPAGNVDATPASYTWVIDLTAPTAVSSVRVDPNPTTASSVKFKVTFSEAVTGVDKKDFSLTAPGLTGAAVSTVSGSGATRTVTVSTGSGHGTLRLNVVDNDTIRDGAGNPLGGMGTGNGNYTSGQEYTVDRDNQFRSAAAQDGWVLESSETSSKGGLLATTGTLRVGDNATDKQYRSLLYFDTADLPDDATITNVTLKIRKARVTGTDPFTTHGSLLADIKKGTFGARPLEIGDFQATASKTNVGHFTTVSGSTGWYQLVLGSTNYKYINKSGVTQFRLRFTKDDNDDHGADYVSFYSGDATTASNRPLLIIEYTLP